MEHGNRKVQYIVTFAVSLTAVTSGAFLAWSSPVIPKLYNNETSFEITSSDISWMVALSSPGFMTGSLVARFISDGFGRRSTILCSAIPIAVGTIIIVNASVAWMLHITRFLWGCGAGMIGTVSSMYVTEIADKDIRGTLAVCNRFMFNFGSFLVMAIGPFVSFQALSYLLLGLPIAYFIACWWVPETPYFLLKEGRVAAARKALTLLSGCKDEKILEDRLTLMRSDVTKDMRQSGTFKELVTGKRYRRAILIAFGLKLTQIMSGSIAVQQYLGHIILEGKSNISVPTALIVFGAVRFVVGIMSSALIDRLGRRPLLIYSYFGTSFSLAIVGLYFFFQEVMNLNHDILATYSYVPFLGITGSYVISTLGFNSIVYVIPAEIFPLNVKSIAMTCLNISAGFMNFVTVKSYQPLKDVTGLCGVFWFYTCSALIGSIFAYIVVPETKGKSFGEIQVEIQGELYNETDDKLKQDVENGDANETTELKELESKQT